jgi:hypothetical protein
VNRAEVQSALRSTFPQSDPRELLEYGDALFAIAERFDIPIESLTFWVHDKPTGKEFTLAAWRLWCAKYHAAREELNPAVTEAQPATPEGPETARHALCPGCFTHVAQMIDGYWWCHRCGVIEP